MTSLFSNARGLGSRERRSQLKELVTKNKVEIVYIQETIKHDFKRKELRDLGGDSSFVWN